MSIVKTAVFTLGIMIINALYADINWCAYSGNTRVKLEDEVKELVIGKDLESAIATLSKGLELGNTRIPKALFNKYEMIANSRSLSYTYLHKDCITNDNKTIIAVLIESENERVTDAAVEMAYADKNFSLRGEKLYWRNYTRSEQLKSAVDSILPVGKARYNEWISTLTEAGLILHKTCSSDDGKKVIFARLPMPLNSMVHKIGMNMTPNGYPTIIGAFNNKGILVETSLHLVLKGCDVEDKLLRQQFQNVGD